MKLKDEIRKILSAAVQEKASDLYFFARENQYEISFKSAHQKIQSQRIKTEHAEEMINYFKYQARMDIAEHRRPQVGAMTYILDGEKYYLRFSSVGDFLNRESLVIRIIYKIPEANYFFPEDFSKLLANCQNRGLILTSGPTGSGKTTLMYEVARQCGHDKVVMCIEDPIEVQESRFFQAQVNDAAGITYEALLKAALRHRPDILIIGEIRDATTAKLAIQASLSGHLVFATVHATSTFGTISRMLELGISQNELRNSLNSICYQRLIENNRGKVKCLLDLASSGQIAKLFEQPRQGFTEWSDKLTKLEDKNEISREIKEHYFYG